MNADLLEQRQNYVVEQRQKHVARFGEFMEMVTGFNAWSSCIFLNKNIHDMVKPEFFTNLTDAIIIYDQLKTAYALFEKAQKAYEAVNHEEAVTYALQGLTIVHERLEHMMETRMMVNTDALVRADIS